MATATVYKRLCGFGSSNTYLNRYLAVVGSTSVYDREACYQKLGQYSLGSVSRTSWLPTTWKPESNTGFRLSETVKKQEAMKKQQSTSNDLLKTNLVTQDNITDDQSDSFFGKLFGGISGSGGISFGKDQSKALIPIILASAAALGLLLWGGVFRIGKKRR